MGLDMYLDRIKKVSENKLNFLNGTDLNDLVEPYIAFEKDSAKESSYNSLIPFSSIVNLTEEVIDFDKIKADYGIDPDANVTGESFIDDKICVSFSDNSQVTLTDTEIYLKYTVKKNNAFYVVESEEIGYWRKANQVHGWFDENFDGVQNCVYYLVTEEQLEDLLEVCQNILDTTILVEDKDGVKIIQNSKEIEKILPTTSGFFFGSNQYDEFYIQDIEHTVDILKDALECTDFDKEGVAYHAWW